VTAARDAASRHGGVATVGRQQLWPNAPSAVPGSAEALLDARAPDDATLDVITADWNTQVQASATTARCETEVDRVARSAGVEFDDGLRERLRAAAVRASSREPPAQATTPSLRESPAQATTASLREPPVQETAAGHDAAVLAAAGVPAGMLFVRNPTGVSHAPAEDAEPTDVVAGVRALAALLEELACR
jgi:N-carbamoyl-L-amino-acid hydrolase